MDETRQPVIVELEEGSSRTPAPSRVIWGGQDLEVRVAGALRTAWIGGTMHYLIPVTCGSVAHTLYLDTGTWTWTIARQPGAPCRARQSCGVT